MKKVLLTGVVLILLILLAVDFYIGNKRTNEMNKTAFTTIPGNSAAASAAVASPVTNDESAITTGENGQVTTRTTRTRKHSRHTRTVTPVDQDLAAATNVNDGGLVVIMDHNDPAIAVEVAKDYTGNMPAPEKKFVIKQQPRRTVHFGIEGGMLQSCFDNDGSSKMLQVGFHAGVLADIAIGEHFAIQPGVRYAMKGIGLHTVTSTGNMDIDTKDRINLNYIEVPVNAVVKFGSPDNARIILGAGPYVAYLLSARDNYETTTTTYGNAAARTTAAPTDNPGSVIVTQGQYNVPVGNNNSNGTAMAGAGSMRSFDWGVGGFVGVETPGGFFAKAGVQRGLAKIHENADGSIAGNNCNYFVSIGQFIGYKK